MVTFLGYTSRAELYDTWKKSGMAFLTVTIGIVGLQYAQGTLAEQGANSLIAGLASALIAKLVTELRKLQEGLPPPKNSLPER